MSEHRPQVPTSIPSTEIAAQILSHITCQSTSYTYPIFPLKPNPSLIIANQARINQRIPAASGLVREAQMRRGDTVRQKTRLRATSTFKANPLDVPRAGRTKPSHRQGGSVTKTPVVSSRPSGWAMSLTLWRVPEGRILNCQDHGSNKHFEFGA